MNVEILAVGSANPRHQLKQADALAFAQRICCVDQRQSRFAGVLYEHAGIATRYTVLPHTEAFRWVPDEPQGPDRPLNFGPTTEERMAYYEEFALPLAIEASSAALGRSGCAPREITHVVTASCTGFTAPGTDSGLIRSLALRPTTVRVHVGYMGCHAAINALRVAHGLAYTDARARILVCAVELCSLHYAFSWDNERMLANALFADGAGAILIGAAGEENSESGRWRIAATGSYLFPGTEEAMTWRVGNHGFTMTISSQLPSLLRQHLSAWLTAWLSEHGLRVEDVRSWAVHPGGPRIVEAVEAAMGLRREQTEVSREVLSKFGNMSSATLVFILESLVARRAQAPCVMLGFGPGLVAEAALLVE
jgi:predicted naringenin-chalcone synthase